MNPVPSPSRIDVIIHQAEAEWWQIVAAFGPFVVLCAVLIAAIGWVALRRRTAATIAGNRSDWWPRARWALEACLDDNPKRREVGLAALELLNTSSLSGKEESRIIAEAWKRPLRGRETLTLAGKTSVDESESQSSISPQEERIAVRAARVRLSTDKKQGIESPSWVREIAKRPL